ncbi:hypothetical protein [Methanolobus sp.]|jgi:hypothetical protein|uniref:hypothetical protein n=1 Tax=Methanolobus sp. TaxID=1874737 RepID=UPI0025D95361|nr:hypothetical protein [Methanolobus sp.]
MEIEDFVIANLLIGVLGSFFLYAATNPLPSGVHVLEAVAIGGLCAYVFNNPEFF